MYVITLNLTNKFRELIKIKALAFKSPIITVNDSLLDLLI